MLPVVITVYECQVLPQMGGEGGVHAPAWILPSFLNCTDKG